MPYNVFGYDAVGVSLVPIFIACTVVYFLFLLFLFVSLPNALLAVVVNSTFINSIFQLVFHCHFVLNSELKLLSEYSNHLNLNHLDFDKYEFEEKAFRQFLLLQEFH